MATKDEYIEHTGHYAPVANDGRFDQANPNITENRHNIEADPNEAYSSANITTGSANRFAHDNPNITSNRHNEEHGTEYIIPEDWNRHEEDSGMPEGEVIRRGKRSYQVPHSYKKNDYLKGGKKEEIFRPEQGMHTTKFSCGFTIFLRCVAKESWCSSNQGFRPNLIGSVIICLLNLFYTSLISK